jgi:hypothetical protein
LKLYLCFQFDLHTFTVDNSYIPAVSKCVYMMKKWTITFVVIVRINIFQIYILFMFYFAPKTICLLHGLIKHSFPFWLSHYAIVSITSFILIERQYAQINSKYPRMYSSIFTYSICIITCINILSMHRSFITVW